MQLMTAPIVPAFVSPALRQWTFLSLVALCVTGCGSGDGLNRQAVSGVATVDSNPIPNGSVTFEPLFQGGIGGGAVISQGKFSIARAEGLPPGKYRISVTGDDGSGFAVSQGKMPGDEIMPAKKQLVPASWNSKSKHEIEIKNTGSNAIEIKIDSKEK